MANEVKNLQKDVLLRDYEIKVNYLKDHLSRMWTRFNIFLTLQTGLAGAKIMYVQKSNETPMIDIQLVYLALILATLWFMVGIIDRSLVQNYRNQIKDTYSQLNEASENTLENIPHTGKVETEKMHFLERILHSVFSPTKIIFVVPMIAILLWLYICFSK
ncbi:MAG: hypothetical protein RLZZ292_1103 [Bacteroidota bacterium]|jgi:biopolymer transport protein ExbD